jgi:hypothetical protein
VTHERHNRDTVEAETDRTLIITVRVRLDPAFADIAFISLRRHFPPEAANLADQAEVTSTEEAMRIVRKWLEVVVP